MYRILGEPTAPILVVTQPPSKKALRDKLPLPLSDVKMFAEISSKVGFKQSDFVFVNCAPHMEEDVWASVSKSGNFLKENRDEFLAFLNNQGIKPKAIVTLGALSARQVFGRPIKITKSRGIFHTCGTDFHKSDELTTELNVLPIFDPGYVNREPSHLPSFLTDLKTLHRYVKADYNQASLESMEEQLDYQWCTDLTEWLENPPAIMAVDSETTGLSFYKPNVFPFTVQLSRREGHAICIPVLDSYYPELERDHKKLMGQLKQLLENPNIKKVGHNLKFDAHMIEKLDIKIANRFWCTQQMLFNVDENLKNKSLAEGTRMYVPALAGYSDEFDKTVDKTNMIAVDKDKLLRYACGDADACLRLAKALFVILKIDERQRFLFEKVQMPSLNAMSDTLEINGVNVNEAALRSLGIRLVTQEKELHASLLARVPPLVKRKHLEAGKALSFTRADFVSDILFTPEGFNLTPRVFTKATAKNAPSERKPSTSMKDHLPYFEEHPFVKDYMELSKLQKIITTYIGNEGDEKNEPTGFWKYIYEGKVRPTYRLDNTVTGRSSSEDPNGQNIPKRGEIAKLYRKIFTAPPGYKLIQADYSQAELRIVAWHANEPVMIQIYKDGLDMHVSTAALLGGYTIADFLALPEEEQDLLRYKAKAMNFGLIYGMMPETYQTYARTMFGVKLSLEEATNHYNLFFQKYERLLVWHEQQKLLVKKYGYVRSLHGAKRHLPAVFSDNFMKINEAERQAINSPIQRFASDLGLIAHARITRDLKNAGEVNEWLKPCMFIHDALVFMVKDGYEEEAMSYIKFYMESTPFKNWFDLDCPVPIVADLEIGPSLAELGKRKNIVSVKPCWFNENDVL